MLIKLRLSTIVLNQLFHYIKLCLIITFNFLSFVSDPETYNSIQWRTKLNSSWYLRLDVMPSSIVKVKTIQLVNQPENFQFPKDKQSSVQPKQMFDANVIKNVVKILKIRNIFRSVSTLNAELQGIYVNEEENVAFNNEYLEEVSLLQKPANTAIREKSTRSLAKDMIIENFNGQNFTASTCFRLFIQECIRVGITQNKYAQKIHVEVVFDRFCCKLV